MIILFAILFVICEIIGFKIVDFCYKAYMRAANADAMYYNGMKKIVFSFMTGLTLFMGIMTFFS